jgi:hypothetical protein
VTPPERRDFGSRLLRRVQRLAVTARDAGEALVPVARAGASQLAGLPARRAFDLAQRALGNASDAIATRLLSLDETASLLAIVVERCVSRHGHEAVLRIVLRRNLLLDGSFLGLIDPVLRGGDEIDATPERLLRGRETLTSLLADLASLDALGGVTEARADAESVLDHFVELRGSALESTLLDTAPPSDQVRVLLMSYGLFLESFLLRSAPQMMAESIGARPKSQLPDGSIP